MPAQPFRPPAQRSMLTALGRSAGNARHNELIFVIGVIAAIQGDRRKEEGSGGGHVRAASALTPPCVMPGCPQTRLPNGNRP